ncbi:MAG: pirin family protein [Flavobacteriales bacterium]|nr:pirin family protein [Flavobacteriales bacterium]
MEKHKLPRRSFLSRLSFASLGAAALPFLNFKKDETSESMENNTNVIKNIKPLGFQWETLDPFLFCVHHEDNFPKGNGQMGPDKSYLTGRSLGDDFIVKDGFRMYHGKEVPGFPGHPHRGFETITVVRKGWVDHADSMGAAGRYGNGDVQWMTAGKGVQHSEMFPLIHDDKENTMELFQIWLNLPAKDKMVDPHFKMMWRESIQNLRFENNGKFTNVELITGVMGNQKASSPPPNSWASKNENEVMILNVKMDANAEWTLPTASAGVNRVLYFYEGDQLLVNETIIDHYHSIEVDPTKQLTLKARSETSILILQGKPIGEHVVQYGPFVMNTKQEIMDAFNEYHETQFGGWPWAKFDQTHDKAKQRFALHADGTLEEKSF